MKKLPDDPMDMDQIYRTYERMVYQFLYMRTHDAHWSQDLLQETFLRAVTSISRYDGSCKLSVWLCQIARHVLWQELRLCRACGFHPGPRKSRCRDSGTAKRRSGGTVPGHPQAFRKGAGSRPVPHHRRTVFPGDRRNSGKKRKLGADHFLPRQIKTQRGAGSK